MIDACFGAYVTNVGSHHMLYGFLVGAIIAVLLAAVSNAEPARGRAIEQGRPA